MGHGPGHTAAVDPGSQTPETTLRPSAPSPPGTMAGRAAVAVTIIRYLLCVSDLVLSTSCRDFIQISQSLEDAGTLRNLPSGQSGSQQWRDSHWVIQTKNRTRIETQIHPKPRFLCFTASISTNICQKPIACA